MPDRDGALPQGQRGRRDVCPSEGAGAPGERQAPGPSPRAGRRGRQSHGQAPGGPLPLGRSDGGGPPGGGARRAGGGGRSPAHHPGGGRPPGERPAPEGRACPQRVPGDLRGLGPGGAGEGRRRATGLGPAGRADARDERLRGVPADPIGPVHSIPPGGDDHGQPHRGASERGGGGGGRLHHEAVQPPGAAGQGSLAGSHQAVPRYGPVAGRRAGRAERPAGGPGRRAGRGARAPLQAPPVPAPDTGRGGAVAG